MRNTTLETLTWVLIYGGLLVLCLGLFVRGADAAFGWTLLVLGGTTAAVGAALIFVRARRADDTPRR
jgi:hypothetical protein